jgi:ribonucleoside-triphosphate reductase
MPLFTPVDLVQFQLSPTFIARYRDRRPPFGFNGLGELVYMRT